MRLLLTALMVSPIGYAETKIDGPVVLLVGTPLSGKATQAAAAARFLHVPVVSVGDLIKDNAPVFEEIRRRGISGMEPETDPVLNRLFEERMGKGDLVHGAILEGYPSTKDHCDYLAGMVKSNEIPNPLVIDLVMPDKTVLQRAGKTPGESRKAIEQRLKDYHREMDVLHLYFPNADVVRIDGTKGDQKVEEEIDSILKERYGPGAKHPQ